MNKFLILFLFPCLLIAQVTAYGSTLSNIYFMVVGKQYSRNEIKLTLLEVG